MMKYQTGPYKKPAALLRDLVGKRLTPKSKFLKRIERAVRDNIAFEQKVAAANRAKAEDELHSSYAIDVCDQCGVMRTQLGDCVCPPEGSDIWLTRPRTAQGELAEVSRIADRLGFDRSWMIADADKEDYA
jgi:hypothetical protein